MPYWNLKGKRESNVLHSENYKTVIEEYMNVNGAIKQSDSAINGCLTDMIFKNRERDGEIETHVEVKWDTFSLKNEKIRKEFDKYALLYFRIPQNGRFKFMIFAKKVSNEHFHQAIFDKYHEEEIEELYNNISNDLEENDKLFLQTIGKNTFKEFIWNTTLINVNIEGIKMAIFQITKNYPMGDDIYLRYQNIPDDSSVEEDLDIICSNLVEIPKCKYIWSAETDCIDEDDLKKHIAYPPPHHFYANKILSFYPFEEYNDLTQVIKQNTIERISIQDWAKNKDNLSVILTILNKTVKKLCQLRGLYKTQNKEHIFFFPNLENLEEKTTEWSNLEKTYKKGIWGTQKRKCPGRLIFKKFGQLSKNPYYLHIGVQISALFIDGKFYFSFLPRKVFTKDGREQVESVRAKTLERFFRKPQYAYNRNLLLEQLFWGYVLFLNPELKQLKLIFHDEKSKLINLHITKILNLLGLDYFTLLQNICKPQTKDDITEEDTSCLNSLFKFIQQGDPLQDGD